MSKALEDVGKSISEIASDDENGSKAEDGDYEDVQAFDPENDLQIGTTASSRAMPGPLCKPSSTTLSTVAVEPLPSSVPGHLDLGGKYSVEQVSCIVAIPWPVAAGKRPPRDMKRLDVSRWYVVCKVMKWGETPALFMRDFENPETDFGFYKPPVLFHTFPFQVGDQLQLHCVGYSVSRNKIATSIRLRMTIIAPLLEGKAEWTVPPPVKLEVGNQVVVKKMKSTPNAGNNNNNFPATAAAAASTGKKKAPGVDVPSFVSVHPPLISTMPPSPAAPNALLPPHHSFYLYSSQQQQQTSFLNASYSLNSQQPQQAQQQQPPPHVTSTGFIMPGTPDLQRAPSFGGFTSMTELLGAGGSAANLLPPSPNIINSALSNHHLQQQPSGAFRLQQPTHSSTFPINSPSSNVPPGFRNNFGFGSAMHFPVVPSSVAMVAMPANGGNGQTATALDSSDAVAADPQ